MRARTSGADAALSPARAGKGLRSIRAVLAWLMLPLLVAGPGVAWGAETQDAREAYLRALERFERGWGVSLERVYDAGRAAARELVAQQDGDAGQPVLRGAPPRGIAVSDASSLRAAPDPRFFQDLARQRGTEVDEEFFSLLRDTYYRDGVTRQYAVPRSDVAVCHVFDHPDLVDLYRNWTRFWAMHPRAYRDVVNREVKALEDMMALSTCACGDQASVETGLSGFLKSFPRSPVTPLVHTRLWKVRAGTSDFRFRCPTG